MKTKEIVTELGIIDGRNAIEVDTIKTKSRPLELYLEININTSLCSSSIYKQKYVKGKIDFLDVKMYNIFLLDYYPNEKYLSSSVDEVLSSPYLEK
jgi:hypothetical protein